MTNPAAISIDHHTHIFSERAHDLFEKAAGRSLTPFTGSELLHVLDNDGITKAAVFSVAYMFASSDLAESDMKALRAENDWVRQQAFLHEPRLIGFFSVNPLMKDAHAEIDRCASDFVGLKLHLANSNVDLREPVHVEQLANILEDANSHGLTIALHLRTRRPDFGRQDAEMFMEHVLARVADVPIQIAHLGGWSGYDQATDAAFAALTELVRQPSLYFDISAVVKRGDRTNKQQLAERLRGVDAAQVLFGSDWPEWTPRSYAADILDSFPLNREELSTILGNRAPWIK